MRKLVKSLFVFIVLLYSGVLRAQPTGIGTDDRSFSKEYTLARVYEESRDYNNALRLYLELHNARPNAVEVSEGLFHLLLNLKRYGEADTLLTDRLSKEKESFDLYLNLALVRSKLGKTQDALDAFNHSLRIPNEF